MYTKIAGGLVKMQILIQQFWGRASDSVSGKLPGGADAASSGHNLSSKKLEYMVNVDLIVLQID